MPETEPYGQHVSAALLTWVHTALGDTDAALDCLERAYDERASMLVSLPSALVWDPLRADPRFHALLRRMNFPETAVSS